MELRAVLSSCSVNSSFMGEGLFGLCELRMSLCLNSKADLRCSNERG